MSNSGNVDPGVEKDVPNAGAGTDQHVSGAAETGTFTTDRAPTGNTPADGSTNAGINETRANRVDTADERETSEGSRQ
jgi:hypothetical protein